MENVKNLKGRGVHFIGPADRFLAEGTSAPGRMSEPQDIVINAGLLLHPNQHLLGKSVLVTPGSTQNIYDTVVPIAHTYDILIQSAAIGAKNTPTQF